MLAYLSWIYLIFSAFLDALLYENPDTSNVVKQDYDALPCAEKSSKMCMSQYQASYIQYSVGFL